MSNDITDFVQSTITGGIRGALGELAVRGIDEARLIKMVIEAGEKVAGYEYTDLHRNRHHAHPCALVSLLKDIQNNCKALDCLPLLFRQCYR